MKKLLFSLFIFISIKIDAQTLTGISVKYNDAYVDWTIYTDDEDVEGNLTMTWQNPDDWSQWTYRIGEHTGTIKTKWNKDLSHWEIRGDNKIISAQQTWQGDNRQWRITNNSFSLDLTCKYGNNWNDWTVNDTKRGKFSVLTAYQNDPRDWNIEDETTEEVTLPMKMTIVFMSIINSVPKD
jgi:hypothetical protein